MQLLVNVDDLDETIALLADPFGHGFGLVQFLGRGYDEVAEYSDER